MISIDDYTDSVENLLKLAQCDTSGSRVAAWVLLSCYNAHEFNLDVTELCLLDSEYYKHAMNVIVGRTRLYVEPHNVVDNGSARFKNLWHRWSNLQIIERAKILQ